jgi:hypothetical protein
MMGNWMSPTGKGRAKQPGEIYSPVLVSHLVAISIRPIDIVISADLGSFTKVWLGYCGLIDAIERGQLSLHGSRRAMTIARRLLALPDEPTLKSFRFSAWTSAGAIVAQQ